MSETENPETDGGNDSEVRALYGDARHRLAETKGEWCDIGGSSYEYLILPDGATKDDVEIGRRYRAVVNQVKEYGVFVSLAGHTVQENRTIRVSGKNDVSGLVHKTKLPNNIPPNKFHEGDEVGVMLNERKQNGDLNFELVACLDGLRVRRFEKMPDRAPVRWYTQGVDSDIPLEPDPPRTDKTIGHDDDTDEEAESDAESDRYQPEHFDRPTDSDALMETLDGLHECVNELGERVGQVADEANGPPAVDRHDLGELHQQQERLEADLNALREKVESTRGWVSSVDSKVDQADANVSSMEQDIDRIDDRLSKLESEERETVTADGQGLPGRFGYAEKMLHDLSQDHQATSLDLAEVDDEDGVVEITLRAKRGPDA